MPIVNIDGRKITVERDSTILDAAKKADIWIPTLCYHPSITNLASCRLCMVELDRGDWKQLVTACDYPVRKDINISTNSAGAIKARNGVMQLLLARSPDSKELKELAEKMGVKETPYPKVTEAMRNCILCGMCISFCDEVIGVSAICFAGRGSERSVAPPFKLVAEDCIACGGCAAICPVGTIQIREHEDTDEVEISPFKAKVKVLRCKQCGEKLIPESLTKKILEKVDQKNKEYIKYLSYCYKCKRKITVKNIAETFLKNNSKEL